jgi:putative ABC transport system permease protein
MLNRVRLWLRVVLLRGRLEREMQEEMSAHLALATERLLARGLSEEEASRAARREFGNVAYLQEQGRDARGTRWVESIAADLRFGLRHFSRRPYSTLTMIVLLALGIGFNTALFTLLYSFVTMPPPGITRDETLVRIRGIERSTTAGRTIGREFSYPEYREYAAQRNLFNAVAAWTASDVVIDVGRHQPNLHSAAATFVTAGYFQVLGVRPTMGAGLPVAARDNGDPELVAVISHTVWERHLGKAPDVLGQTIKVNDIPVTIVGVAPARFAGARTGGSHVRLWLPLNTRPLLQRASAFALSSYDSAFFGLVARLTPGIAAAQTMPTVQAIASRAEQQTTNRPSGGRLATDVVTLADNYFPPSGEQPSTVGRLASLFFPLLILLIPCTNVSALLVGLALARRREIAVRLSLGAARRRIVRQLITESVLLALAAAVFALLIIWILLDTIRVRMPDLQLVMHWPAVTFAFGLAIATGILFGVSPALHATRLAVADVLKESATSVVTARSRLHSGLVVAQIAMTQPLLLAMGALIQEIVADLQQLPASTFNSRIVQVSFNTNPRYGTIDGQREDLLRGLERKFAALPGVAGVVRQQSNTDYARVTVHPSDRLPGGLAPASIGLVIHAAAPDFFPVMGIPFLRGQVYDAQNADGNAVVIGSDLARRLWGTADPIGRRFVDASATTGSATRFVVVGVVDEAVAGRSDPLGGQRVYAPGIRTTGSILVRSHGPAEPLIPVLRAVANSEAPQLPITRATTLSAIEAGQRRSISRATSAAVGGGVIALLLSAIGLYAIVAFAVGQRTREIGIRTALGADHRHVVRMFFWRGLRLSFVGLVIGLSLCLVVLRVMWIVQGNDPGASMTLLAAAIAAVVVAVAAAATWIPARRAAAVDPLRVLRAE